MLGGPPLLARILGTSPVCCLPLNEQSGTTAADASGNSRTGVYQRSGSAQDVSLWVPFDYGLGTSAPFWGNTGAATSRCVELLASGNFASCCNWDEYSMMIYAKPYSGDMWSDNAQYYMERHESNDGGSGINRAYFAYKATDNDIDNRSWFNGTARIITRSAPTGLGSGWHCYLWTVSQSANAFHAYIDNQEIGGGTSAGTWTEANLTLAVIGATAASGSVYWRGWLAYVTFWNKVLSAEERARVFF